MSCEICGRSKVLDLEAVIAGLMATGRGNENTGIRAVARKFHRPCEGCGGVAWETRPEFPGHPGQDGTRREG